MIEVTEFIGRARNDAEAELCTYAKVLKRMGATAEEIKQQVDYALEELVEQEEQLGDLSLSPQTGEDAYRFVRVFDIKWNDLSDHDAFELGLPSEEVFDVKKNWAPTEEERQKFMAKLNEEHGFPSDTDASVVNLIFAHTVVSFSWTLLTDPRLSEYGLELYDGSVIEWPDEGIIHHCRADGFLLEEREPGDANYQEWKNFFEQ